MPETPTLNSFFPRTAKFLETGNSRGRFECWRKINRKLNAEMYWGRTVLSWNGRKYLKYKICRLRERFKSTKSVLSVLVFCVDNSVFYRSFFALLTLFPFNSFSKFSNETEKRQFNLHNLNYLNVTKGLWKFMPFDFPFKFLYYSNLIFYCLLCSYFEISQQLLDLFGGKILNWVGCGMS